MARFSLTKKIKSEISWVLIAFAAIFAACSLIGCGSNLFDSLTTVTYVGQIDEKIKKINAISKQNNISDSFFYITDLHWEYNDKKSPLIIRYIKSRTKTKTIVFGGDYISYFYSEKEAALASMKKCVNSFATNDYYAVMGNHETNVSVLGSDKTPFITAEESNAVVNKGRFEKSYYCVNDKANTVCKIILDTNIFTKNGEQYNWLKETLLSLDTNVTVLIFMHIYNDYKSPGEPLTIAPAGKLLNGLLGDLATEMSCSIGGIFSGHTHRDFMDKTDLGYTTLSTACDGRGRYSACDDLYERNNGEFSEQAFDVVQIDTEKRKVFLTRIGAGYDREYTY